MPIYNSMVIQGNKAPLPTYGAQKPSYVPGTGVSARIDDSAIRTRLAGDTAVTQALAGLGKSLQGVSEAGLKLYDDYSKTKATELLTRYRQQVNQALYNGENGLLNRQGEAAFGIEDERAQISAKARDELLKDQNDLTRTYFLRNVADFDDRISVTTMRYQQDQYRRWQGQTFEAAAKTAFEAAARNYADPDAFARYTGEAKYYVRQLGMNHGLSGVALDYFEKQQVAQGAFGAAIQQAIANKDYDRAQHLLNIGGDGGTISENNIRNHNIGNVKNTRGSFNVYASDVDGGIAIADRVLRYSNAPEKGWHATNLLEFCKIYAPAGDGNNNPQKYADFLAKRLGVKADTKLDWRDPNILAGVIRGVAVMEHGKGELISVEDAQAAAQAALAGQKPRVVGEWSKGQNGATGAGILSPKEQTIYQTRIDEGRKKIQEEDAQATAKTILASIGSGDIEELETLATEQVSRIEDFDKRRQVHGYLADEFRYRKERRDIQDGKATLQFYELAQRQPWSYHQCLEQIDKMEQAGSISRHGAQALRARVNKKGDLLNIKRTEAGDQLVAEFKVKVDREWAMNGGTYTGGMDELYRALNAGELTPAQVKDAENYAKAGGHNGSLAQTILDSTYKRLGGGKKKDAHCPPELAEQVRMYFEGKKDKLISSDEIEKVMAQLMTEVTVVSPGYLFGDSTDKKRLYEVYGKDFSGDRLEVPEDQLDAVKEDMRRSGQYSAAQINDEAQQQHHYLIMTKRNAPGFRRAINAPKEARDIANNG